MLELPKHLMTDGDRVSPRGQDTYELRDVLIEISDPSNVCMTGLNRGWNERIAVAEFLQLVGGFSDPERMVKIQANFSKFLNGGSFHGAYGPRTSMQWDMLLNRLMRDPSSRQGVVTIWDPLHDLTQNDRSDTPCTLNFTFQIRDAKLYMNTHMRSNDVWWGWSYDLYQFSQLQWTIANVLGLQCGTYSHFVNSFHLYQRDVDAVLKLAGDPFAPRESRRGINAYRWDQAKDTAHDLFYARDTFLTRQHPKLYDVMESI